MSKINHLDSFNIDNNVYRIDKSYKYKAMKKNLFYKNSILPKYDDSHMEAKWLGELENRYCNLYKNAPLIICFISDYMPDSFKDEFYKRTGFKLSKEYVYSSDITLKDYRQLTPLEILEDYMLGYDTKHSSDLEKMIAVNRKHPSKEIEKILREFDLSKGNIGFSKFDEAMKVLLDIVYSFVITQKEIGIKKAVKTDYGYSIYDNISKIPGYVLNAKLDVLERYYSILSFKNSRKDSSYNLNRGMKSLKFTTRFSDNKALIRFSLVDQNKFLSALSITRYNLGEVIRLGSVFKEDIYLKLHDEISRYHNARCNSLHVEGESCDAEFFLGEEDIFYVDNKFIAICPCCGSRVKTDVISRHHQAKIETRIKKRSLEDYSLERKILLLSELVKLGEVNYNQENVKVKGKQ